MQSGRRPRSRLRVRGSRTRCRSCTEFAPRSGTEGYDITVIKSLDHWPDLGSDLDLYTNAAPTDVLQLMMRSFAAQLAPRSWGDRLARKWNFVIPGLPEAVEIHMGRLGQTGEQVGIAASLASRAKLAPFGSHMLRVPAAEDRLMISTMQRMYRHFYFRLCDIVDTAAFCRRRALSITKTCDSRPKLPESGKVSRLIWRLCRTI